jgi:hypothetical protein
MRSLIVPTLMSLALLAPACDSGEPAQTRAAALESAPEPEPAPAPAPAPATEYTPAPLSEAATQPASSIDPFIPADPPTRAAAVIAEQPWQTWLAAEAEQLAAEAPEWFAQIMSATPTRTRAGFLRMVGPHLESPHAAPVLLHRYQTAGETPEVQAAVIDALARTNGEYAPAIAELLGSETDAGVRVAMMGSLQRAAGASAIAGLAAGLSDPDEQVRIAAASAIAHHPEGAQLGAALTEALATDSSLEVQRTAARGLGYLGVATASATLASKLDSPDAKLRLAALQAIDRVDPSYAAALPQLSVLVSDHDAKVARAATSIAAR